MVLSPSTCTMNIRSVVGVGHQPLANLLISTSLSHFTGENSCKVAHSGHQGFSWGNGNNSHLLGMITAAHADKSEAHTRLAFSDWGGGLSRENS